MKISVGIAICIGLLIIIGGCLSERNLEDTPQDIRVVTGGNTVRIEALWEFHGLNLIYDGLIEEESVLSSGIVTIVKEIDGKTVIATASGPDPFTIGQTVLELLIGERGPEILSFETKSLAIPENRTEALIMAQTTDPVEGVFVLDTFVFTDGTFSETGSFFIGARNLHQEKIQGIDIMLEYDPDMISIEDILPMEDEDNIIEVRREWNEEEGIIDLAMAYKRGNEKTFVDPVMLYKVDFSTKIRDEPFAGSTPVTPFFCQAVAEDQILFYPAMTAGFIHLWAPVLLGDFDHDGVVDTDDLIMFADVFLLSDVNPDYDTVFDIGEAEMFYGEPWSHLYSRATPTGVIDTLDLIIFAAQFFRAAPQYFANDIAPLRAALANINIGVGIGEIIFIEDVDAGTTGPLEFKRLIDLKLNGKTFSGDIQIETGETGVMTIGYGIIDGDLIIDAPNAEIHNYAEVTGQIIGLP